MPYMQLQCLGQYRSGHRCHRHFTDNLKFISYPTVALYKQCGTATGSAAHLRLFGTFDAAGAAVHCHNVVLLVLLLVVAY